LRVVVLTSSTDMHEVNLAYHIGASSFMVKPADFENVIQMFRVLTQYWLRMSEAPTTCREPKGSNRRG
jgi:response regulator of citrate/malate metabolism